MKFLPDGALPVLEAELQIAKDAFGQSTGRSSSSSKQQEALVFVYCNLIFAKLLMLEVSCI